MPPMRLKKAIQRRFTLPERRHNSSTVLCRDCGYRFSNPSHKKDCNSLNKFQQVQKVQRLNFKTSDALSYNCQGSRDPSRRAPTSLGKLVQTLVEVETRSEKPAAGATERQSSTPNAKILEYAWWLKKEGYAESTIIGRVKLLKTLVKRGANLYDPESVKKSSQNKKAGAKEEKSWQSKLTAATY